MNNTTKTNEAKILQARSVKPGDEILTSGAGMRRVAAVESLRFEGGPVHSVVLVVDLWGDLCRFTYRPTEKVTTRRSSTR